MPGVQLKRWARWALVASSTASQVLIVPPGWWHQVHMEDRVLSISKQLLGFQWILLKPPAS